MTHTHINAHACGIVAASSVARGGAGGLEPPIGLKSMQSTLFLARLRPIFALKTKIAPPQWYWR